MIRNGAKLRGTRIYIHEDLCPASQEVRRAKLPLFRQAKSEGKITCFNQTNLIIKEGFEASSGDEVRLTARAAGRRVSTDGSVMADLLVSLVRTQVPLVLNELS